MLERLELRNTAPRLLETKNCEISVPGMYKPGRKVVKIGGFERILPVLGSKQHPRVMTMNGSDGKDYKFLLKGHEDNRQDERAMQLFGLVNTLLSIDPLTQKKNLSIRLYSIIPLSPNAGLLGMRVLGFLCL